ncbi:hypothetical protein SAMN05444376_1155 [Bacteroides clarus YIT 12056]|uniref:DUF5119 domain-containing protein n=1 Tax=Bacteroides clarus YIT 12056 TaxID=762984 RepID=A0ABN0CQC6_9BACE|nr:hypothetical protein [Bacteroides clarus]EGF53085.1 hypothetical protein HMPREF9445_01417 [Bacteroides clarus YIT 12056]SHG52346.1 hypothetical protein SAMN05444376_1155 [Bacteroides clarus YIT 12056]
MKNKTLTYLVLSLLCCMSACTSVDLCPEAEHPHITDMRVRLNWGDISKDEIPAEMHIVASRIINTWRTHGIVDTSADPATDNNITLQQSSSDSGTAVTAASSFYLRGGEYNIFVINEQYADTPVQTDETKPTPIISIDNLDNYIHDNRISVKDLYLQISSMGDEKPGIVEGNDLPDFNPDDEYLKEVKSPIFYAVQKNINIQTGQPTVMEFDMQRISQRINIIFNIRTEGNIKKEDLSAPIIELSGTCGRFNISDACLDTTRLYRTVHQVQPDEFTQTGEGTYRCAVHFHTLGIIPSAAKGHLNGPGILQVALQVSTPQLDAAGAPVLDADGNPVKNSRYIYGAINPYDELTAAQLIEVRNSKTYLRYSKEDVNIEITTPLVIKADKIVPNDTGMGWQPHDPSNPDDDIIIEI